MRKHRHFAVIIALAVGSGLLAQHTATAQSPTQSHRPLVRAAAPWRHRQPPLVHIASVAAPRGSTPPADPLVALTVAMTKLSAPTPSPSSAPAPERPAPATAPAGGPWLALRRCESSDDYADDTGNGYYGAYQFSLTTWEGLGYGGLPSAASPAVQDQAARRLQARSGWGQWPVCARRLGLD